MHTQRLRTERQALSCDRSDLAKLQDQSDPAQNLVDVCQQRTRLISWHESAIVQVTSVRKRFFPDFHPRFSRLASHISGSLGINDRLRPPLGDALDVTASDFCKRLTGVIKSAVKFDVMQTGAAVAGDAFQSPDLLQQEQLQFVRSDVNSASAKVVSVPRTGVGAQAHAELFGEANAPLHGINAACVAATGHVCRSDGTHQGASSRGGFAFTEVTVEIELHERTQDSLSTGLPI